MYIYACRHTDTHTHTIHTHTHSHSFCLIWNWRLFLFVTLQLTTLKCLNANINTHARTHIHTNSLCLIWNCRRFTPSIFSLKSATSNIFALKSATYIFHEYGVIIFLWTPLQLLCVLPLRRPTRRRRTRRTSLASCCYQVRSEAKWRD